MENASKALTMAGAVLLTIMILGMGVYFYSQFKSFPSKQEEAAELEQITKFNQDYESYYKQKMYGVDVVTVLNKAISNNKKYANSINGRLLKGENNYYIDVQIKLLTSVVSSALQYKEVENSNGLIDTILLENQTIRGKIDGKGLDKSFVLTTLLPAKTTINLLDENETQVYMNKNIETILENFETVKIKLAGTDKFDEFNYTIVNSGLTDFKRKFFKCTSIEYNEDTSRVSRLIFEEISRSGGE